MYFLKIILNWGTLILVWKSNWNNKSVQKRLIKCQSLGEWSGQSARMRDSGIDYISVKLENLDANFPKSQVLEKANS